MTIDAKYTKKHIKIIIYYLRVELNVNYAVRRG